MKLLIVDTNIKKMYIFYNGKILSTYDIIIGKNGSCNFENKKEGDKKTPKGLYNLGICFSKKNLSINYPCILIDDNSYFVDDVNSKYYNCFVELKNIVNTYDKPYIINLEKKEFSSSEHMIDYDEYEYALFVEYNINPIIKGKGSAIFIHECNEKKYTSGCIGLNKKDMESLIYFIDKNVKILIL